MARRFNRTQRSELSAAVVAGIRQNATGPARRVTSGAAASVIGGSMAEMNNLFGQTSREYVNQLESLHRTYMEMLSRPDRLSRSPGTSALVERVRRTGEFNLSVLNNEAAMFFRNQLSNSIDNVVLQHGFPTLDVPSTNLYRNTVKFDIDMRTQGARHPLALVLNQQHFNVDPSSNSPADMISRSMNPLTPTQMKSAMNQIGKGKIGTAGALNPFGKKSGTSTRMLILDTETTGVGDDRVARSIATIEATMDNRGDVVFGRRGTGRQLFLRQAGLEGGIIQTPGGPKTLAEGANILEGATGRLASIDVARDPEAARKAMNDLMQYFLQYDRIIAKNADFDIRTISQTARSIAGATDDSAFMETIQAFETRAYNDASYVSNIDVSLRAHMKAKFDDFADSFITRSAVAGSDEALELSRAFDISQGAPTQAEIRNFLYAKKIGAKELFESLDSSMGKAGRGFTPAAMNNLVATTNFLDLIHQDAFSHGPNSGAAGDLMRLLSGGSHVAETDDYLAGFMAQYVQTGRLDFDPGNLNHLPAGRANFIRETRRRIAQSASPTMTTNIADVSHLTRAGTKALRSSQAREILGTSIRGLAVDVMSASQISELAAETGLSADAIRQIEGKITYSQSLKGYAFSSLDDRLRVNNNVAGFIESGDSYSTSFRVGDNRARAYMGNVVRDALSSGAPEAIRTSAASKIVTTGLDYSEQGILERAMNLPDYARRAFSGFNINTLESMDKNLLVDALTNTSRLMATEQISTSSILAGTDASSLVNQNIGTIIRGALERGEPGIYARIAASVGNPYATADITERIFSVEMAKRTASVAKNEGRRVSQLAGFNSSMSFLKDMDILSEFGMSTFNIQDVSMIAQGDKGLVSGKMLASQSLVNEMQLRVSNPSGGAPVMMDLMKALTDETAQILDDSGNVVGTGAELNKVRYSLVNREAPTVNAFLGGQGAHNRSMSLVLAESLYDAQTKRIGMNSLAEIDDELEGISKDELKQLRNFKQYADSRGRDVAISEIAEKLNEGGLGFARVTNESAEAVGELLTQTGAMPSSGNDIVSQGTSRVVRSEGNVVLLGHSQNSNLSAVSSGNTLSQEAAAAVGRDRSSIEAMSRISEMTDERLRNEILQEESGLKSGKVLSARQRQVRAAYQAYRKPAAIGVGALLAAGAGYYGYSKIKEAGTYDEVMDAQPTTPARAPRTDLLGSSNQPIYSRIQDPLATAGVVGNLDRNKIGHTKMGANKYNDLFSV